MLRLIRTAATALLAALPLAFGPASAQPTPGPSVEIVPKVGHTSLVVAIAFSPDGRFLASGSSDDSLKLWEAATGRLVRTINAHDESVDAVAFAPDGRTIATGSFDNTVTLWDAASGREIRRLKGHSRGVNTVAFSPDGLTLASAGLDRTIRFWNVASGKTIRTITVGEGAIIGIAFSPDGKRIASRGYKGPVKLFDVASGKPVKTVPGLSGWIGAITFTPDGRILAASETKDIEVSEVGSGRALGPLSGHRDEVMTVAISPDGRLVASGGKDHDVKLWDLATRRALWTQPGHAGNVLDVTFSPDGRSVASGDTEGGLILWDVASGAAKPLTSGALPVSAFSRDGGAIATTHPLGIKIWDEAAGHGLRMLPGRTQGTRAVTISADRRIGVSGGDSLQIWDGTGARPPRTLSGHEGKVDSVAVSPDGRTIGSGGFDGTLRLWDVASGRNLRVLHGHPHWVSALRFSPDGRTIVSGDQQDGIRLWDVASGKELASFVGHQSAITEIAFSPDGRQIVSSSTDGTVKRWDPASGREVQSTKFRGGGLAPSFVAYSLDGRRLLIPGGRLDIWEASSGRQLRTLLQNGAVEIQQAFSADGRTIVTTGQDDTIRHWNADTGDLLATTVTSPSGASLEWVTITPEGFFDASEKGAEQLTVVRGLESYSIDQAYQALYRPDLVREKLAGDPQGKVREAAQRLDLDKVIGSGAAPRVALASPGLAAGASTSVKAEEIPVAATITDTGGGIGRIEWRVNGVTLGVETRGLAPLPAAAPPPPSPRPAAPLLLSRTLPLAVGENAIEVVAYNSAGLIASDPGRLLVTREGASESAGRPRLYVLAVGVNKYWDSRLQLAFASADATALGEALRTSGGALYESVEVTTVLDEGVTAAKLETQFSELAKQVRPEDVFVFFVAGHGKTVDGRFYFIPQDFRYSGEELIVTLGIGQDQWQEWLARIPARKSVLLFDTCESGSLTGDRLALRGLERVAALDRMTRATGRTTLTASTDTTPALEGFRGHGVFTYALLDALGRADASGDGLVDVTELASFVDSQVPEISQQAFGQRQVPQMKIVGSNFPVARQQASLSSGGEAAAVPVKPTHVVIAPSAVFERAGSEGAETQRLQPGTQVSLMKTEQGWVLVAREGKRLGFVAKSGLAPLQ